MSDQQIKIEKGVPLPVRSGSGELYPFSQLGVGDSFFLPDGFINRDGRPLNIAAFYSTASCNGRRTGRKFRVGKVDGGIRVWRLS